MKRHQRLQKERQALITARENTPCVAHKGKYSYESTLVLKVCELTDIVEKAMTLLEVHADSMGFGGEYEKILSLMKEVNDFHTKSLHSLKTGEDFGAKEAKQYKERKEKKDYGDGVFGLSWEQIEQNQGGKISR